MAAATFGEPFRKHAGFWSWRLEPPGLCMALAGPQRIDDALVDAFVRETEAAFASAPDSSLILISDARGATGYSVGARPRLTKYLLERRARVARAVVIIDPAARLMSMGVSVGKMALELAGLKLEVFESAAQAAIACGVRSEGTIAG
ncbi:MAG: hypothetical protein WKG00_00070 [Polyangiaceae bacterium]